MRKFLIREIETHTRCLACTQARLHNEVTLVRVTAEASVRARVRVGSRTGDDIRLERHCACEEKHAWRSDAYVLVRATNLVEGAFSV